MRLLNSSKGLSIARFVFFALVLMFSFKEELSSAEKVKVSALSDIKMPVSALSTISVVSFVNGTEKLCTGVLVSGKSVLTSKQCLKKIKRVARSRDFNAQIGSELSRASKLVTRKNLKVGLVQLKRKFRNAKPTKLYSASRMGFGKNFLVAGLGKKTEDEIGYLTAFYTVPNSSTVQSLSCFAKSSMPSLVRSPTAVVDFPTYGFGNCFFESEAIFQNVGAKEVLELIKASRK